MNDGPTPEDFRAKVFRDREHTGDWRVEKLLDDGASSEVAIFSGGDERQRAIRYADREYGAFDEIELEPYQRLCTDHRRDGTEGSNLLPSSGESTANLLLLRAFEPSADGSGLFCRKHAAMRIAAAGDRQNRYPGNALAIRRSRN